MNGNHHRRERHDPDEVIRLFNRVFRDREHTVLVRGAGEPLYCPAEGAQPARIEFAHGFFSSALHEIAHWCIAGPERRRLPDLGYWYAPDGRTPDQQREFEQVEVKPQALEWIFCVSADFPFRVSCDNLVHGAWDIEAFRDAIHAEVLRRLAVGLPERARCFSEALCGQYSPGLHLTPDLFPRDTLR